MMKKLTKHIWYGSDTIPDEETGKLVAAPPPIADNDGSKDWHLKGLTRGELYLNDYSNDPALFVLGSDGLVKRVGGTGSGGGSGVISVNVDILEGDAIKVDKKLIGEDLKFTINHGNTSEVQSTNNKDVFLIQNLGFDDFGHVTSVNNVNAAKLFDDRYIRKDIDDTDLSNLYLKKDIRSSVFLNDYDGKGWEIKNNGSAWFDALQTRQNIFVGNKFGSPSFSPGFAGWGHEIDTPTATGTFDNIFVRKNFTAYTITYSQIFGLGGSQIVSDINKIASVEEMSDRYRCFMDSMDGLMLMNLRIGDGARIQTRIGTTSIKYLFGRVINVSADYFDIAKPLLEGEGAPEAGDFVLRWGNNQDKSRQGLIYLTTADQGAPFVAVYDGITGTSTKDALKVLFGNLSEVRTTQGVQLSGYGGYLNGIYIENSSIILDGGKTIEQQFSAMNGELNSKIEGVRNDMSLEKGNILRNSSFSENTNYWRSANSVHFINISKNFLWLDGSFYVEKDAVADIYRDGNRNVLRILNTSLRQSNDVMDGDKPEGTYSISLYAKVLRPGTLTAGFTGSELLLQQQLGVSENYQKISKSGAWDGQGDFSISFTGEVLIYGVSLFNDELADAVIKLQTKIFQNEEMIKLSATKDYVDHQTNQIYIHYDSEFTVTAEQISGISTKVDNINNTIETAGWITEAQGNTLFATKQLEDGNKLISYINQTATTTTISSDRINLYGAVTFQMFDPALTNKINNKADIGDVTAALRNYVTSSDLKHELKGYALAESLSELVSSETLSTLLKNYATQNYANSQAEAQAKNAFDTITDAMINGDTNTIGGLISADVLAVKNIFANAINVGAELGGFSITKEGIFSKNKYTSGDSGNEFFLYSAGKNAYLGFSASGKWAGLGLNVRPSALSSVTSALLRIEDTTSDANKVKYGGTFSVSGGKKNTAIYCSGGFKVNGPVSTARLCRTSNGTNSIISEIGYKDRFIFQVTSNLYVKLPSSVQIKEAFGQINGDYNDGYVDITNSAWIEIIVLNNKWSTASVGIEGVAGAPLLDANGNVVNNSYNPAASHGARNLEPGDSMMLAFHNNYWYTINYSY